MRPMRSHLLTAGFLQLPFLSRSSAMPSAWRHLLGTKGMTTQHGVTALCTHMLPSQQHSRCAATLGAHILPRDQQGCCHLRLQRCLVSRRRSIVFHSALRQTQTVATAGYCTAAAGSVNAQEMRCLLGHWKMPLHITAGSILSPGNETSHTQKVIDRRWT